MTFCSKIKCDRKKKNDILFQNDGIVERLSTKKKKKKKQVLKSIRKHSGVCTDCG